MFDAIRPEIEKRKCSRCKKIKPLSKFSKNKMTKHGYQFWCKQCFLDLKKDRGEIKPELPILGIPIEDDIIRLRINTPRIGKLQHKINL